MEGSNGFIGDLIDRRHWPTPGHTPLMCRATGNPYHLNLMVISCITTGESKLFFLDFPSNFRIAGLHVPLPCLANNRNSFRTKNQVL